MFVALPRLELAWRRRAPAFPLTGKFRRMRVRFAPLAVAWAAARCENDLSMERCLVALSTTRGEGLSEREPQSWLIIVRHREAIEHSGPFGFVGFWQSDGH